MAKRKVNTPQLQSQATPAMAGAVEPVNADARLQAIGNYIEKSVGVADPALANLGAVSGGLTLIAYRMEQAIIADIPQCPAGVAEVERVLPTIGQYLQVTKQLSIYTQLMIKWRHTKDGDYLRQPDMHFLSPLVPNVAPGPGERRN